MSGEFNINAARLIEDLQLDELREKTAVKRGEELNALLRAAAARGGAVSGGLLKEELNIIFALTEQMIDTAITNRKELARSAPEMLHERPYLQKFQNVLDEMADGAVIAVQQRHAGSPTARQFPPGALSAILRDANAKATMLKKRINIDVQKLVLEGMAVRPSAPMPTPQITNVFHAPVGNVAQHNDRVTQAVNTRAEPKKKAMSLEAKIAIVALIVSIVGVVAAWLAVPGLFR